MRRFLLLGGTLAAIGIPLVAAAMIASAAPRTDILSGTAATLSGSVVAGIKLAQPGDEVTLSFTEKNTSSSNETIDVVLQTLTNATEQNILCVEPNGSTLYPDGSSCEPGTVKGGQKSSSVVTVSVTGADLATVSAKACIANENTGGVGPCTTLSFKIA